MQVAQDLGELAECMFGVIERTERGAHMVFENDVAPELELPVAEEYLMAMLGALLENAVRFTHRRVRIAAEQEQTPEETMLIIEDDGDGLDISAEQALMRGGRLDEASHAHHGLGLAIVRDLVEAPPRAASRWLARRQVDWKCSWDGSA